MDATEGDRDPAEKADPRDHLESLEQDLAAVESAMESIEAIAASDAPGGVRAAQIAAVASRERFPLGEQDAPVEDLPAEDLPAERTPDEH